MLILSISITIIALLTYIAGKLDSRVYDDAIVIYDSSHRSLLDHLL